MASKVNIKEGGHEDNEVAEIFLKFKGQISNLPEEFGTLNLQEGVQRFEKGSGSNEPERVNPQQHALAVAPLNSMPYIGPPTPPSDLVSTPPEQETEAGETVGPAMIFLPSHSTEEELNNLVDATRNNHGVLLTGSAAMGQLGPIVGLVDIWESEDSYVFRVSLPGVSRDEKDFSCDVDPSGKITIKGVTTTGEKVVCKYSQVFTMMSQNMPPPGHFSVEFELPGPVNNHSFTGNFGIDGILEGIVKKS